jgi:3-deoxy-D-manno-octulosonic-acid transferase
VKDFVSSFETEIFFTVKYDYWYNLLEELKHRGVKIYVISALFYEHQVFLKVMENGLQNSFVKTSTGFFIRLSNHRLWQKK